MKLRSFQITLVASLLAMSATYCVTIQAQRPAADPSTLVDTVFAAEALIQPKDLAQMLRTSERPMVLQVGSHVLYAEAHISGAEYVGAAGTTAGIEALRQRAMSLKKDRLIVIYCGCCPWDRCPNIRPAYKQLEALGFTQVKVLYLANNFGADWADKGYPVAKGR